jgi:hypothetical protein
MALDALSGQSLSTLISNYNTLLSTAEQETQTLLTRASQYDFPSDELQQEITTWHTQFSTLLLHKKAGIKASFESPSPFIAEYKARFKECKKRERQKFGIFHEELNLILFAKLHQTRSSACFSLKPHLNTLPHWPKIGRSVIDAYRALHIDPQNEELIKLADPAHINETRDLILSIIESIDHSPEDLIENVLSTIAQRMRASSRIVQQVIQTRFPGKRTNETLLKWYETLFDTTSEQLKIFRTALKDTSLAEYNPILSFLRIQKICEHSLTILLNQWDTLSEESLKNEKNIIINHLDTLPSHARLCVLAQFATAYQKEIAGEPDFDWANEHLFDRESLTTLSACISSLDANRALGILKRS